MSDTERDFGELYAEYQPRIRRCLAHLVGESDAEDLTQVVFVKVSQALKDFRGDSGLSTWIYRIAWNVATDWRRSTSGRHGIRQVLVEAPSNEDWEAQAQGKHVDLPVADQVLIRREMNQCIRQVIDGLPTDYRHVITLSDIDGLKDAEIAGRLGVSLAAVKMRLHRARGLLRKAMEARCDLYRDARLGLACDAKGRA
jgi:RNA polymerase sigma-70 factor (ECF subfamily)